MQQTDKVEDLEAIAKVVRRDIVEMITAAKSGHPGGSLSAVEILVTLFFDVMRHDPNNPKWPQRDRFILSKGHACPVLYAVMAECGYTPKDQLKTLRKLGSIYQGHPDVRFIPALEASTGSLGEGLSLGYGHGACGDSSTTARPAPMSCLGDGEIQEGQIWEAAMFGRYQEGGQCRRHRGLQPHSTRWLREGHHGRWSRWPKNGAASAGTPSKWTATDIPALQKAFAEAAAHEGKTHRDHCSHDQRERRFIHGKQSEVSRDGSDPAKNGNARSRSLPRNRTANMPGKTKFELKMGMATREAFGKSAGRAGAREPRRGGVRRRSFEVNLHRLFRNEFPDRFFECGIAEANMVAIGAGLASAGKIPFASSFSVFPDEQRIRAASRDGGLSQRKSESRGHAQRHFDRRRWALPDEHRGSEFGLLAAGIHGDFAGR